MIQSKLDREQSTVIDFFSRIRAEGIRYAVLRNYELFPSFGHDIDTVVQWSDLPSWRSTAISCAKDHGWSALTECGHWARSSCREHNIHILRFYSAAEPQYLQVDAFHSLLVLGLPLADEETLLRGRVWDDRGFYKIDEQLECLFRLFQIARLTRWRGAGEKLERYRKRVLLYLETTPGLTSVTASIGFPDVSAALSSLRSGDLRSFKIQIDRRKRAWLMQRLASRPLWGAGMTAKRLIDLFSIWLRPCGFDIRAYAVDERAREPLERVMARLVGANVISAFTSSSNVRERLRVRERCGVVIRWVSRGSAHFSMDQMADEKSITQVLLNRIVQRHTRLFDQRTNSGEDHHTRI